MKITPEEVLEDSLRARIRRADGKPFAFTIAKSYLGELLPEDRPLHPIEIFAASEASRGDLDSTLRIPKSSMDKLREIAQRLEMVVETDSHYCRIRDVIRLIHQPSDARAKE